MKAKRDADRAEFTAAIKDLQAQMRTVGDHGPAREPVDRRPEAPSSAGNDAVGRVRDRELGDDAQREKAEKPGWIHRGPANDTLGLAQTAFGFGLAEVAQHLPSSSPVTTAVAGIIGTAVAGIPVLRRHMRKAKNADRPED